MRKHAWLLVAWLLAIVLCVVVGRFMDDLAWTGGGICRPPSGTAVVSA